MMEKKLIRKYDKSKMFDVLKDFHLQVKDAIGIAGKFNLENFNARGIKNIIITGLGGSAIGGDLFRSYTQYEMKIPVSINRNYTLPEFAGSNTLVIISSYSGNTEETISAYKQAIETKCRIICITSGGEIKKIAAKNRHKCIVIPGGLQPRCALGYSFFTLLTIFIKLGFIIDRKDDILEAVNFIEKGKDEYTTLDSQKNLALQIAIEIKGKLPVVYSSADLMDIVNLRWRGQIS